MLIKLKKKYPSLLKVKSKNYRSEEKKLSPELKEMRDFIKQTKLRTQRSEKWLVLLFYKARFI